MFDNFYFLLEMSLTENDIIAEITSSITQTSSSAPNTSSPDADGATRSKVPSNWAQKWSADEDQRLLQAIEQHGTSNWKLVAEMVGTRNAGKFL